MTAVLAMLALPSVSIGATRPLYVLDLASVPRGTCFPQGSVIAGSLLNVFNGFGSQCVNANAQLVQSPGIAANFDATHAALSISRPVFRGTYRIFARFETLRQLRTPPNVWEVGWVLFDYVNLDHFYALVVKPSGWEIEKEWCDPKLNPCQAEQFLAAGSLPAIPADTPLDVVISQSTTRLGLAFSVRYAVAHKRSGFLAAATDTGSVTAPYRFGHVGLYDEEAVVAWRSLVVRQ